MTIELSSVARAESVVKIPIETCIQFLEFWHFRVLQFEVIPQPIHIVAARCAHLLKLSIRPIFPFTLIVGRSGFIFSYFHLVRLTAQKRNISIFFSGFRYLHYFPRADVRNSTSCPPRRMLHKNKYPAKLFQLLFIVIMVRRWWARRVQPAIVDCYSFARILSVSMSVQKCSDRKWKLIINNCEAEMARFFFVFISMANARAHRVR